MSESIVKTVCALEELSPQDISEKWSELKAASFAIASTEGEIARASMEYVGRRLDRQFKEISLAGESSAEDVQTKLNGFANDFDATAISNDYAAKLQMAIDEDNMESFLAISQSNSQ